MALDAPLSSLHRVVIVGNTGSGKTTLAAALAAALSARHIELDALYWDPGWSPAPREVFRSRVAAAIAGERWVADGNYSAARDLVWPRADVAIWLDYPIRVNVGRLFVRSLRRGAIGAELWNGNRERLRDQFLSRDSLFVWLWKTHRRNRRNLERIFADAPYSHVRCLRFFRPAQTERWLARVTRDGAASVASAP